MTTYKRIDGDYRIVSVNSGDSITLESDQVAVTGNLAVDGTIALGSLTVDNLALGNLTATGNVTAARLIGNLVTGPQPNITQVGTLDTLTVTNGITGNLVTGYQPNLTLTGTLVGLSVDGNAVITGNLTSAFFFGDGRFLSNVVANVGGAVIIQNGTSNVNIPTAGSDVLVSVNGISNTVIFSQSTTSFATTLDAPTIITNSIRSDDSTAVTIEDSMTVDGSLTVVGSLSAGSLAFQDINVPGNITAGEFVIGSNIVSVNIAGINITGNLLTSNQPNITQLGNLVSLNVIGNVAADTIVATSVSGTLTTNAQTNITSVGTLDSLAVSGNVSAGNLAITGLTVADSVLVSGDATVVGNLVVQGNTTTANVTSLTISDPLISLGRGANNTPLTSNDGLDRGLEMYYYNTAERIAFVGYKNDEASLMLACCVNVANNVVTVNNWGNANVGNVVATGYGNFTGNVNALNLTSQGSLTVSANVSAGNLSVSAGQITAGNIVNGNANGVGNIGSSSGYFNTVFAKATSAQYADLAELYLTDDVYPPGTVMQFGGTAEITRCESPNSHRVAGIISNRPAYVMNAGLTGEFVATLALLGRVMCYVRGPVESGDLLVSDTAGWAVVNNEAKAGCIIGKSLQKSTEDSLIEIVVGRQ